MNREQCRVGMLLRRHDPWLFLEQRSENRVSTRGALSPGRAYSNPDLSARLVQAAAVGPHHRHREPQSIDLTRRNPASGREPIVTLSG